MYDAEMRDIEGERKEEEIQKKEWALYGIRNINMLIVAYLQIANKRIHGAIERIWWL